MNSQTLILAVLNFHDASGYEIKKHCTEGIFSYFVDTSYGSIYPTLSKLVKDGLIYGVAHAQNGKPDKTVYSITPEGKEEFVSALKTTPARDKYKSEFLLVAMCSDMIDSEHVKTALDSHTQEVAETLNQIKENRECCNHATRQWIMEYGIHVKSAALEYLNKNGPALLEIDKQLNKYSDAAE